MTVSAEGTLIQHIDGHGQSEDKYMASHEVNIIKDTPLFEILNADSIDVNSFHHQVVKHTGSLKVAAKDENDVIEAVYMPGKKFYIGIQWHPERMYSTNIHAKLIFDAFIRSCY